ncbi:MAG TPA: 4'-phosphopantetheinyl transferase superfamily protein, partial [Syntrophales bacterium]|nr:4'-phosphopantetheinyl transferase superfamily protein [Syntrophales bacterium]
MDLTDPQNTEKSQDTRFVNRVFTRGEQELISRAENRDAMLWAIWAGKEAAYKAVSKNEPAATSVPRSYNVSLNPWEESFPVRDRVLKGSVNTPYGDVTIEIIITADYVHCIGGTEAFDNGDRIVSHVERIDSHSEATPRNESAFVRKSLGLRLSEHWNVSPENIEIRRVKSFSGMEPPVVLVNGKKAAIDISLSHDGSFAAYVFAES